MLPRCRIWLLSAILCLLLAPNASALPVLDGDPQVVEEDGLTCLLLPGPLYSITCAGLRDTLVCFVIFDFPDAYTTTCEGVSLEEDGACLEPLALCASATIDEACVSGIPFIDDLCQTNPHAQEWVGFDGECLSFFSPVACAGNSPLYACVDGVCVSREGASTLCVDTPFGVPPFPIPNVPAPIPHPIHECAGASTGEQTCVEFEGRPLACGHESWNGGACAEAVFLVCADPAPEGVGACESAGDPWSALCIAIAEGPEGDPACVLFDLGWGSYNCLAVRSDGEFICAGLWQSGIGWNLQYCVLAAPAPEGDGACVGTNVFANVRECGASEGSCLLYEGSVGRQSFCAP